MNKYIKALLYTGVLVLWFFVSQYIAVFGVLFVTSPDFLVKNQFLCTLLSYILNIIGLLIILKEETMRQFNQLVEFEYKHVFKYIGLGIVLWFGTTILNGLLLPFFPMYDQEISSLFTEYEAFIRFLVIVIGAPIIEELIFRSKIQNRLIEVCGVRAGIVFQGLIFGVIHPFSLQKIYASVLGISFGYVAYKSKTYVSAVIMHITINAIGWGIGMLGMYMLT